MTKEIIALDKKTIKVVPIDTPVKTTNGVHYELTQEELTALNEGIAAHEAKRPKIEKDRKTLEIKQLIQKDDTVFSLDWQGNKIYINEETINALTSAVTRFIINGLDSIDWKFEDGIIKSLNSVQIKAMAKVVFDENQKIRTAKEYVFEELEKLTKVEDIKNKDVKKLFKDKLKDLRKL